METLQPEKLQNDDCGVEVRASRVPNAGSGLFATRRHAQGSVICAYTGQVHANAAAWKLADKSYLMKLGPNKYVDALHAPNVLARYINDCRGKCGGYNVEFEKLPDEDKALVIAMRDIDVGEELFVNYGRFYWIAYNLSHPESPVR
jgi:hypothetical protein|uniref:SET domain-containing protein n=1 Tax=Globisporangium ultimum (strain ATCC 200006 / CBS 805.95 / DAOM BR144) TaxID=431595 RepID=K3XAI0_GLOUD